MLRQCSVILQCLCECVNTCRVKVKLLGHDQCNVYNTDM